MAKKKSGSGDLNALTLKQADKLSRRLALGADRLPRDSASSATAIEIYEAADDLHNVWMSKWERRKR